MPAFKKIINALIEIGMTSIIRGVLAQARKAGDPLANIIKDYQIVLPYHAARAQSASVPWK